MTHLYCPECNGALAGDDIGTCRVIMTEHGRRLEFSLERVVWCTSCALVSEVSQGHQLIDLGNVRLSDCECPFVPGMDGPRHVFIQTPSHPLRGRDS